MQAGHLQRCESGECVRGGAFSVQKAWHERPRVSMFPESRGVGGEALGRVPNVDHGVPSKEGATRGHTDKPIASILKRRHDIKLDLTALIIVLLVFKTHFEGFIKL